MAKKICLPVDLEILEKLLTRGLQSGNISFLLGSGSSNPAIKVAGTIEKELNELIAKGAKVAFDSKILEFLIEIQSSTNSLFQTPIPADVSVVLNHYQRFLGLVSEILEARRTPLLSKQATIFTTNYDVFVEAATESVPSIRLNDGFHRTPAANGEFSFRPETFFEITRSTGNLFNYEFSIPGINLVKIHGSITWREKDNRLLSRNATMEVPSKTSKNYVSEIEEFRKNFSFILPTSLKFRRTTMERVYYDLLRIFANRLELENSLLIVFGFSFEDEHLLDITKRALKNPGLIIVVCAHSASSVAGYQAKLGMFNNVAIVHPVAPSVIEFEQFNSMLESVIPKSDYDK